MKSVFLSLLLATGYAVWGQNRSQDTTHINFDHIELSDVVVIDNWENEHALKNSVDNHQLELQLKQLKGVNLISRGSFAQEVVYRGQADGRIQVKLNGMRVYSACTDRMDPSTSYIVANNLSTAEVTSACESHCANNGLAGSLNLETKEPTFSQTKPWRFGLIQQYQTNTNGFNTAMHVESNTKKLAWRLNGSWLQNGNYYDGNGQKIQYSQNQKQNWALNSVYRLSPKRFLKLDFIYDLATDVGYPALTMDVSKALAVIGGLTYSSYHSVGPFTQFDLKVYHNDIYHEMDDTKRENVFMHMDMPGWSQTAGLTFNAFDWTVGKHTISGAAEYYTNFRRAEMTMYPNNDSEPPMFMLTWPDARIHGMALGLTDNWKFGKNHVNTTLRMDYETSAVVDDFGNKQWEGMGYDMSTNRQFILPQIKSSITHHLSNTHALTAAIGYGMRGPTTSELYGFYLYNAHDGFDYLGNPDLKPEQLLSAEVGYTYTKKKFNFSSTLFLQQYYDYIFGLTTNYSAMTYGANGVREYENISGATFWGVELGAEYAFSKSLVASAKGEYLRGFRPEADLPLIPPLQGTIGVNYSLKRFSFLAQSRMAAEQKHFNTEYGDRYTPGYVLLDAAIGYTLPLKKMNTQVEVAANNLLDTYYRDHLNWGGIPSMGRNIVLKLKLEI
ncbi:TonB-dependent receptor [Owenweeksia hongkongensis]|uniref:TonB-dependent receptor n=1 Tax=Owenweeksia hongkongensis TaxID=253245 RepID=UPI003A8FFA8B